MRKRKVFGSAEVNLTSLLDVLFCILFIVLISGMKGQDMSQNKIDKMQEQLSNYKTLQEDAVMVGLSNTVDSNNNHMLQLSNDKDESLEEIIIRKDNLKNVSIRIDNYINKVVESNKNCPIYIIFNCDKSCIYKAEFDSVKSDIDQLVDENKEVFLKIKDKSDGW